MMESKERLKMEATKLNFEQVTELLLKADVERFNLYSTKVEIEFCGESFYVREKHTLGGISSPEFTFQDTPLTEAYFDGNRLDITDAQGFKCHFDLDVRRDVVYLANATGDETGHGTVVVTNEDLNKVPFERGPGVVLTYLTEIEGKKYVQGNLELAFNDEWWGQDAHLYDSEKEVRAYCKAVRDFIRPRLAGGALLLSLDEDDPGRLTVQVAVPLESIVDRDDALRKLGAIFGTTADEADVADFGDLPAPGVLKDAVEDEATKLSDDDESYGPKQQAEAILTGYVSTHPEFEEKLMDAEAWRLAASIELNGRGLHVIKGMSPETLSAIVSGEIDMPGIYQSARASKASN
ncbi:TPA: hypothetical protein ACYLN4_007565 [Burkholderia lata]